jgi:hypothetical protein
MKTLIAFTLLALTAAPAQTGFMGHWNITGTGNDSGVVYWLQVSEEGGALKGRFLNRASSPYDLSIIKMEGDELVFHVREETTPQLRAKLVDGKLIGTTTSKRSDGTTRVINWVGVRPPVWPRNLNANGKHTYGKPIALFDGKTTEGWGVQMQSRGMNWTVTDGVLSSPEKEGNNLISNQKFNDFKIEAEYAIAPGNNGGIYVRGRYELQLLDDAGKPTDEHGHMAIYGRMAPSVNASLPANEWQKMEAIVVGNLVTVTLNGKRVQDNSVIGGITGGALDANESEPGPIMLQGDHGKIMFRKVVVTPILKPGS